MDDYNVSVLTEAKNEYMARLVSILSPLIIQGIKSIFKEAWMLCLENDEEGKYLMTFQNFLSRVPKWNSTIINEETERIVKNSKCNYLEDLLTCVHVTQLKILTSVRVAQKQKKIEIDIPKLSDFIHKSYIQFSRRLYVNVYLFEKNLNPLTYQKYMRECEILCKESILEVVRDSMPVEQILRSYIDETTDVEIIEEKVEKIVDASLTEKENASEEKTVENVDGISVVKKPVLEKVKDGFGDKETKESVETNNTSESVEDIGKKILKVNTEETVSVTGENPITKEVAEEKSLDAQIINNMKKEVREQENKKETDTKISFNDTDRVLDMGTNRESPVTAPKTIDRLEQISYERNEQRKLEDALDEEDEEDDAIKISNDTVKLEVLDIHSLDKELNLKKPKLTGVETL